MTKQSSAWALGAIAVLNLGVAPVLAQQPKQKSPLVFGQVMTMEDLKLDISGLGG